MVGGPGGSPANSSEESPGWSLRAPPGALGLDRAGQGGSGAWASVPLEPFTRPSRASYHLL